MRRKTLSMAYRSVRWAYGVVCVSLVPSEVWFCVRLNFLTQVIADDVLLLILFPPRHPSVDSRICPFVWEEEREGHWHPDTLEDSTYVLIVFIIRVSFHSLDRVVLPFIYLIGMLCLTFLLESSTVAMVIPVARPAQRQFFDISTFR